MFQRWFVTPKDLQDMTPLKARDIIIKCFFAAQKETFAKIKKQVKLPASDQEISNTIIAAIRAIFAQIGGDFDSPTEAGLIKVVAELAGKAKSWGTPDDIIKHHKEQIQKVLTALQENLCDPFSET